MEEHSAVYRNTLRPGRNIRVLRPGGTHYRLEENTAFWRNTAVYRNMLRPGRNILPPGGAH
jgi:hypothetical protein